MIVVRKFKVNSPLKRFFTTDRTIDKSNIEVFSKISYEWWNINGALKPLHSFNKLRIPFVREGLIQTGIVEAKYVDTSKPLRGLKILDVGCGGGILTEPLSRLGAEALGLDADVKAVEEAKEHARQNGLQNVSYVAMSIEDHAETHKEKYDAVVASEILEHVIEKEHFLQSCVDCLKPGGTIFVTTMNRTCMANILGIEIAESMGLVPRGAHQIDKFIKPHELQRILEKYQCGTKLVHGFGYFFITNEWFWTSDHSINYGLYAVKSI